jgi:Xaa-Pro aminopeptidase
MIKMKTRLLDKGIGAIVLINTSLNKLDPNIYYFLGKTFEYCVLIIKRDEKILIVPKLEYGRAKEAIKGKKIMLKTITQRDFSEIIESLDIKGKIGINFEYISLAEFNGLKKLKKSFIDISEDLKILRMQKNVDEIKKIRTAARYADKIIANLFERFRQKESKPGKKGFKTEREVMEFLDSETKRFGLKTSFKPIIASGKNSANPHHDSNDILHKGFCVIDFGVKYKGYCSDMTRTIYLGRAAKKEIEDYELVLKTNNSCIDFCRVDKKCSDIDRYCRKILGDKEKYFIHGLGHGIGVEIHEGPTLNSRSKDILKSGCVITIEPGIYYPGRYGIRIEDDLVLKNNSKEILTKTTKKLLCFYI